VTSYDNPLGDYSWYGTSEDRTKRIQKLNEEARLERIRVDEAAKAKQTRAWNRLCGHLESTGIGRAV
jgi:hypothetical protein